MEKSTTNICLEGFKTFFKIGLFTLGGGFAMLPLIEEEVVTKKQWLSKEDFLDLMAVAQSLPGVFAVNFSIYIGQRLKGFWGSLSFALGTIIPSFVIILLIALFFANYSENRIVEAIFKGIRPAVVALIAIPCIKMARAAHLTVSTVCLPIATILAIWIMGISPVYVIMLVAFGGFLYGKFIQPNK